VQQRITLSDIEWPFHASRAISVVAELLVAFVGIVYIRLTKAVFTWTWLRYVRVFANANASVCRLLSIAVCNVGAPYPGGWIFWQHFFHRCVPWLSSDLRAKFCGDRSRETLCQGVKRKI